MANVPDSSSFRILARGLELPEDTFVKMHGFDDPSETYRKLGVMTLVTSSDYRLSSSLHEVVRHCAHIIEAEAFWSLTNPFGSYPRTEEDEQKSKNVWLKGHTGTPLCFQHHISESILLCRYWDSDNPLESAGVRPPNSLS